MTNVKGAFNPSHSNPLSLIPKNDEEFITPHEITFLD